MLDQNNGVAGSCVGHWSMEAVECSICKIADACGSETRFNFQSDVLKEVSKAVAEEIERANARQHLAWPKPFQKFRESILTFPYVREQRGITIIKVYCGASRFLTVVPPVSDSQLIISLHGCTIGDFQVKPGVLYDRDPSRLGQVFMFPNISGWRSELAVIRQLHSRFVNSGYVLGRKAIKKQGAKKARVAVKDKTAPRIGGTGSSSKTKKGRPPRQSETHRQTPQKE